MKLYVKTTKTLQGTATCPSSKSQSIRALILALLANGQSKIDNLLNAQDTQEALQVCQQLGAHIIKTNTNALVTSQGLPIQTKATLINSGNSGITTRFILPVLGLRENFQQDILLDCGEQMRARLIHSLVLALRSLGMTIDYLDHAEKLPIKVSGKLRGGYAEVAGITSQYLSALLLALPCAELDSEIQVKDLHERPYVEMSLQWLRDQKISYQHHQNGAVDIFHIEGQQKYSSFQKTIAADFSSASYLLAAGALFPGQIIINNIAMDDPQGDKRLIPLLQQMGAEISFDNQQLFIQGGKSLTGLTIDANDIPDLLPTLAVIGTQAQGKTDIINVKQARLKETDRIHSMVDGLRRLGAKIDEGEDSMTIYPSQLKGAAVKGYDDHRTVMSLSIAGLLAEGTTVIDEGEAITKTFPTFVELMQSLGAVMEMHDDAQ